MPTVTTRTICCKLALAPEAVTAIRATAAAFNAAATFCAQVAWTERLTNRTKLHRRVYGPTRSTYGLGAQLACCARDKAAAASGSRAPVLEPVPAVVRWGHARQR